MDHPVAFEAAKASPVGVYVATNLAGFSIPEIISYLTLIYASGLAIQTLWKGAKWLREYWEDRHFRRATKRRRKRT